MTPSMTAFRALAITLFGAKWQNPTARALGKNPRTVRYWVSSGRVPGYAVDALRLHARERAEAILGLLRD